MPTTRERKRVGASVSILIAFAAIALLVIFPVRDYDTFWHVANGRESIARGEIIQNEYFSFTAPGKFFHNHEWLSQIFFFLAYDRFDTAGLVGFKVLLVWAAVGMALGTARVLGAGVGVSALVALFAVIASLQRFVVRPQLFTAVGICAVCLILFGYQRGRFGPRALWALPTIMVLWDFLHGAVFGLLVIAVFVGAETGKHWLRGRTPSWPQLEPMAVDRVRWMWIFAAITLVAMLLSPFGPLSYDSFLNLINARTEARFISEFQPTPLEGNYSFWGLLALTALLLVVRWRRLDATELALVLPFAALGVRFYRGIGPFAMIALPLVASHATQALHSLAERRFWLVRPLLLVGGFAVCLGFTGYIKFWPPTNSTSPYFGWEFGHGVNGNFLPVGSVRFIRATNLSGNMYNTDRYGGYLSFFLTPERKIFHYNHPSIFQHLYAFLHAPDDRARWDLSYALIGRADELQMFRREGWVPVYWEPTSTVMVAPRRENREVIARYAIVHFRPLLSDAQLEHLAAIPTVLPVLSREITTYLRYREDRRIADVFGRILVKPGPAPTDLERITMLAAALERNGDSAPLQAALGMAHYRLGELQAARERLERASAIDPEEENVKVVLAYIDLDLGELARAADRFEAIAANSQSNANAFYGLGLARLRLGDRQSARQALERYLQLVPGGPFADKARRMLEQVR